MKERNKLRCIYHAYSATLVTFVSQVEIETPNYIFLVFYPCVIYENVDIVFIEIYCIGLSILKVIFLKSNPETLISPLKRGCNPTMAMGNVDRTFCPKSLSTKQTFALYFLISVT